MVCIIFKYFDQYLTDMINNVKKDKPSISKTVEDILSAKPFIQDLFRTGMVNYSGVARHITPEIQRRLEKEKVNAEAVIMAVKRFGESVKGAQLSEKVGEIVSGCSLFVKNDLAELTLRKSKRIYDAIIDSQGKVDYLRGEIFYVLQSAGEIEIVTDQKIAGEFLKRVGKEDIMHKEMSLALIGIKIPEKTIEVPGVIYYFAGFLAMNGITLINVASTFTELSFIISDEHASRAYTIFSEVIKKARESGKEP